MPATNLTVLQILKDKPVTIKSQCQHSENDVRAAVILIINSNAKLLAEYKRPTVEIVIAATNLIISQYSHLSIDDIRLCIQNLCSGLYGEIIALDFERYGKALKVYSEEKRVTETSNTVSNQFPNSKPVKLDEETREKLYEAVGKPIIKKVELKKDYTEEEEIEFLHGPKTKTLKKGKPIQASEIEQEAFNSFDKIRAQQEFENNGKASTFINWNGAMYTMGTWLEYFFYTIHRNDTLYQQVIDYLQTIEKK